VVVAFVLLNVKKGGEEKILDAFKDMEGIEYAQLVYGEYDVIIKVKRESIEDLQKFLTKEIRAIPQIEKTTTMITIK